MELIRELEAREDSKGTLRRFGLFRCSVCNKAVKRHRYGHGKTCSYKCRKHATIKHGDAGGNGKKRQRLYDAWRSMKSRCNYPKNIRYQYYGGKGVKVCKEWHNYTGFRMWALSNGYKDGLVIDRIDSNGNYEPSNCQWITKSENSKKASRKFTINEVVEIRKIASYYGKGFYAKIARAYGVCGTTISDIANNKTYKEAV